MKQKKAYLLNREINEAIALGMKMRDEGISIPQIAEEIVRKFPDLDNRPEGRSIMLKIKYALEGHPNVNTDEQPRNDGDKFTIPPWETSKAVGSRSSALLAEKTTPQEKNQLKKYYKQNKTNLKRDMQKIRKSPRSKKPGGVSGEKRKHYGAVKELVLLAKELKGTVLDDFRKPVQYGQKYDVFISSKGKNYTVKSLNPFRSVKGLHYDFPIRGEDIIKHIDKVLDKMPYHADVTIVPLDYDD
jgi:hypothetical protein